MKKQPFFEVTASDAESQGRCGMLSLNHGTIETPVFMPVGTAGTVKAIDVAEIHRIGFRLILGNTYHLYLRPGRETMQKLGGLHKFASWEHNVLTDSGGFQVFSLAHMRKITAEGVRFQSHIDGSRHLFTPESVAEFQAALGSDIQMALDVCTGPEIDRKTAEWAMGLTHSWAERAVAHWKTLDWYDGTLFPIIQGNFYPDLRKISAETLLDHDLPGIAIGGLSVGEPFYQFVDLLAATVQHIPLNKPRYVMGIGTPEYILSAIELGIDMFDCVFPTRAGRNGTLFTRSGRINLKNAKWRGVDQPPDSAIDSFGGRFYSLGYLHHLFKAGEMLGPMLATRHNLVFLEWLVRQSRSAIRSGRFAAFRRAFLSDYNNAREHS